MPVGNEMETPVSLLKFHPVLQGAVIVADVHAAGWTHAGYNPPVRVSAAQIRGIPYNATEL